MKSLALDKRKEVASLPLDFRAERDDRGQVTGLSNGQRVMLRAGLKKLQILEDQFTKVDRRTSIRSCWWSARTPMSRRTWSSSSRPPGLSEDDILRSTRAGRRSWPRRTGSRSRERLFDVDRHEQPKVIVSVLMLREGFDVNNICVIVPLRSSQASILLEQTVGRGFA